MKKEIEDLQDVWLNECDKKHCPILDYLLHQKKEAGSNAERETDNK